jgi:4-amino-4-deoxy-L-arabinose transferase-like glycosyltransferase
VIAGVFVVIPLYLLAKEWFGRVVAIVACVLMIANPYFISFSRLGYNNSQSLFPITLSIYFFALAARKGSYFYLWWSGLVAGFGFYTYSATLIVPIILCFVRFISAFEGYSLEAYFDHSGYYSFRMEYRFFATGSLCHR